MKNLMLFPLLMLWCTVLLIPGQQLNAQARQNKKTTETLVVRSSVVCGMCDARVKRELSFEKGITDVEVNLKEKLITVKYRPDRTDPDKIRRAITRIGYDADDLPADEKAYNRLPACCKKDAPPH